MSELTIRCSDLGLDSVSSLETYGTGKLKTGEYWMVCLAWVGLVLILYLAPPSLVTSHLELVRMG